MKIFFDIDQTLINPLDRAIRPYAKWCMRELKKANHSIYLWSRAGEKNCWDVAKVLGIPLDNCFKKPPMTNLKNIDHLPMRPDFIIDDDPTDVLSIWQGMLVLPYCATYTAAEDKEMIRVLDTLVPVEKASMRKPRP